MTNLTNVQAKIENNMLKNEESLAIAGTLSELFGGITKYSNSNHNELLAIHELNRISGRMSVFFDMLSNQLEETTEINVELLEEISQLKNKVVTV